MFVSACRWMLCKFDPKAADNIRALPNGPIPGVKCITGSSTTAATKTTTAAPKIGGIGGTGGVGIKNSAPTLNTGITASSKIGAQNLGVPKLGAPSPTGWKEISNPAGAGDPFTVTAPVTLEPSDLLPPLQPTTAAKVTRTAKQVRTVWYFFIRNNSPLKNM